MSVAEIQPNGVSENITNEKCSGKIQTDAQGFQEEFDQLPPGYFSSPFFIGSFLAIGMGFWAGNSGFAYAAPILSIINADLGPDTNVQWVALVHPVGLSVGMVSISGKPQALDCFQKLILFAGRQSSDDLVISLVVVGSSFVVLYLP